MAVGFPAKTTYADGDVFSASDINDTNGTLNLIAPTTNFAAGKNKIINGDFAINQRAFTTSSSTGYGFDRFIGAFAGATGTYSAETFTAGSAPVAGYEAKNFARFEITTGNDFARLSQPIEDVRTFAGQTITVSFWAKGTNPTTAGNLEVYARQLFGSGGSPSADVITSLGTFVLTANWTRYSVTGAIPSISGKTIGTTTPGYLSINFSQGSSVSTDAWTLDLWGVQAEAGSTATAFQTATGTIQGELAACQRYYFRTVSGTTSGSVGASGFTTSTTAATTIVNHPVTMRTAPSSVEFSGIQFQFPGGGATITALTIPQTNPQISTLIVTSSGLTTNLPGIIRSDGTTTAYIALNAEF
jgi:hypothetical protein